LSSAGVWAGTAVRNLDPLLENLATAQAGLLRAADAIPADRWTESPAEGRWSAGEVVCHLIGVERAIISRADKILQKPPRNVPLYKRFRLPMAMVEIRFIRRRSPVRLQTQLLREKEVMLAELREVRGRTLAFIDETKGRDLSMYMFPQAFLGMLNLYEWFQMIASHEVRHTKQMKEIGATLPKAVVSLQK
jgi:DinB superfamily